MRRRTPITVVSLALLLVACSGSGGDTHPTGSSAVAPGSTETLQGEVLVSAAASLTDAFGAIATAFDQSHPAVSVVLNLAGSSALREQILEGAPADVFASADTSNMDAVVEGDEVRGEPRVFAHNRLVIAVPKGNPAGITGLADFGRDDLLIGLCAADVPCGEFARRALANAGVTPKLDTNEPDVRALLTKIEAGELDAGITYVTDVASAKGTVDGIDIPQADNVVAVYPMAVLAHAPNPGGGRAFVAFVLSGPGQAILSEYGFASP